MEAREPCGQQAAHFIILHMQTAGKIIKMILLAKELYASSCPYSLSVI